MRGSPTAYEKEGADAWFARRREGAVPGRQARRRAYDKVDDLVEVWFDSGSTHAFVLEDPKHFPGLAGIRRTIDGGQDTVMYLEGSDQHRGWFQSSLLESCGTRGRAPFDHHDCLRSQRRRLPSFAKLGLQWHYGAKAKDKIASLFSQ